MATESGAAVFRAIADFAQLRREARSARKDLKALGDEADRTSTKLGNTDTAAGRVAHTLGTMSQAARDTKKDLAGVGAESARTNQKLSDTDKTAGRLSGTLTRLGSALTGVSTGWDKFHKSDTGKKLDKLTDSAGGLLTTLLGLAAKGGAVALIGVAATASIGPILSLVGAVVALSGAVGIVPGMLGAVGFAGLVLKLAFSGVSDVLKNLGADSKTFEESIKGLPPSMQKVAWAAREIFPALSSIKTAIQSNFWAGLEVPLKDLAGKYIPMVRAQAALLAGTFNKMAKEFAGWLGQKSTVTDLNKALGNINVMFRNLLGAVKPLAQAFLDLFVVSTGFLPALGKGITDATQKFADFIHGARESGKLKDWIAGGLAQLRALGTVLVNIGRIFVSVFTAGSAAGHGFFQTLAEVTGKFADFLKSAEGQSALAKLFAAVAAAGAVVLPILKALVSALADVIPVLVAIGEKLGPGVASVIAGISQAVQAAKPHLLGLAEALGKLLDALGSAGPFIGKLAGGIADVLTPVVQALTWLITTLVDVFNMLPAPVQDLITHMGGFAVAGLLAVAVLNKLVGVGAALAGSFGKAATSVGKLIDKLGGDSTLATGVDETGAVIGKDGKKKDAKAGKKPKVAAAGKGKFGLLGAIAGVASAAAAFDMGGEAMDAFGQGAAGKSEGIRQSIAAGLMGGAGVASMFGPWGLAVAAALAAASLIISNWGTVGPVLGGIWASIAGLATSIWTTIGAFITSIQLTVGTAVVTAWTFLRDTVTGAQLAVGQAVVDSWTWISSTATGAATWVKDTVVGAWVWLRDTVTGAQQAAGQAVVDSWNWITGTVGGATNSVIVFLGRVGDWLGGAWSSAWSGAGGVVRSVADGIAGAINAVVHAVEEAVSKIGTALRKIGEGVSTAGGWVGQHLNPLNWFAKGGVVPGAGNRDSVPVMATPGEYMEPKSVTKKWLPLLRAINPHDTGGQPADVLPMLGVNDLLRNAAGATHIAAQVASSVALSSGRTVGAGGGAGPSVGDVHVTQIIHNPLPEKPSESASKRIGRAAALGVHIALNGAA